MRDGSVVLVINAVNNKKEIFIKCLKSSASNSKHWMKTYPSHMRVDWNKSQGELGKGIFIFIFIQIWEKQAGQYVKDVLLIIYEEWRVTSKQQTALSEMTQYISMAFCPCDQLPLTVLLVSLYPVWCTTDANQGFFIFFLPSLDTINYLSFRYGNSKWATQYVPANVTSSKQWFFPMFFLLSAY